MPLIHTVTSPRLLVYKAALSLAIILGVSGCQTTEQPHKPDPETRFIKTVPKAKTAPQSISAPKTQQALIEPKRIFPKINTLQDLAAKDVHTLLGKPSFKRTDGPAEIWQYRVATCTLDLFLYENLDTSERNVAHYEIRLQQDHPSSERDCFEFVIKSTDAASKAS